jgi:hypothetical protein
MRTYTLKHVLGIVDAILALVCLLLAAKYVAPRIAVIATGIEVAAFLAVSAVVIFCLILNRNEA